MTMPSDPLRDVMLRTMANLAYIEQHAGPDGPFEVTQLINSFLGALAHPWETHKQEFGALSLADAHRMAWPSIAKEMPSDADPSSLGDLLRLMRNALAHGNITLIPGPSGDIEGLRLWNSNHGRRTWGAFVSVQDMRAVLTRFVALAETLQSQPGQRQSA